MRILCLTPWFPASPGEQSGNFILDSVAALKSLGHVIKVVVVKPWHPRLAGLLHEDWGRPPLKVGLHDPAFEIVEVDYLSIPRNYCRALSWQLFYWAVMPTIAKVVEEFSADVILAHTDMMGAAAVKIAAKYKLPSLVVLHGINTSARLDSSDERMRLRTTLEAATKVVLVGEPLREYFARRTGRSNHFHVVHNGFQAPGITQQKPPQSWHLPLRLISVSNLHKGKGIDITLKALARLLQTGVREWRYTIIGEGKERTILHALVLSLGLRDHVVFAGGVPHSRVYDELLQANVFVLPSWREAFGIAWLEAMAVGLLAIGVKGQGPAAFIREGETGLLVKGQDVDDLVLCLQKLFTDPERMQQIARQGQASVMREFTWTAHAKALTAVCESAIAEQR